MENSDASNPSEKIKIQIRFTESKCLSFALTDYALSNKNKIDFNNYEFELNLNIKVDEIDKSLHLIVNMSLFEKQSENLKQKLASLQSLFIFNIFNFDDLVKRIEDKKFNVEDGLLNVCFGISISTTRGMYNVKLENTLYSNAILPVIDIDQLRKSSKITPTI